MYQARDKTDVGFWRQRLARATPKRMKLTREPTRAGGPVFPTALSVLLSISVACGGGGAATTETETDPAGETGTTGGEMSAGASSAMEDPERWPRDFVTGPGGGPALYLSADPDAAAVGYVSPDVGFRIAGFPREGRIPVRINGGLKVKAWLTTDRMSLYAQQAQRIEGTPTYLGAGDAVRVIGPDEAPGMLRVEITPNLGRGPEHGMPSFPAVIADTMLGTTPPADAEPVRPGPAHALPANTEVQIFATPDSPIATIPAMENPPIVSLIRARGRWKKVLVGTGPYIMGYVNVDLTPVENYDEPAARPSTPIGEVPLRLQNDQQHALWRVAEGARIRSQGRIFTIVDGPAYARELERFEDDNTVDVFVAVDDDVAVRGLVRIRDLQPVETDTTPPAEAQPTTRRRGPTRVGGGANDYLLAIDRSERPSSSGGPTRVGGGSDDELVADNGGPLPGPPQPQPANDTGVAQAFQNARAWGGQAQTSAALFQLLMGDVASSLTAPGESGPLLSGSGVNLGDMDDPIFRDPEGQLRRATREIQNLRR